MKKWYWQRHSDFSMEGVSQKYKWSQFLILDLLALAVRVVCVNIDFVVIFANITLQRTGSSRTSCFIILVCSSDVYDCQESSSNRSSITSCLIIFIFVIFAAGVSGQGINLDLKLRRFWQICAYLNQLLSAHGRTILKVYAWMGGGQSPTNLLLSRIYYHFNALMVKQYKKFMPGWALVSGPTKAPTIFYTFHAPFLFLEALCDCTWLNQYDKFWINVSNYHYPSLIAS